MQTFLFCILGISSSTQGVQAVAQLLELKDCDFSIDLMLLCCLKCIRFLWLPMMNEALLDRVTRIQVSVWNLHTLPVMLWTSSRHDAMYYRTRRPVGHPPMVQCIDAVLGRQTPRRAMYCSDPRGKILSRAILQGVLALCLQLR